AACALRRPSPPVPLPILGEGGLASKKPHRLCFTLGWRAGGGQLAAQVRTVNPDRPIRVAVVTGPERCGIAHYTDDLVRAMPADIEVTVFRGSFDRLGPSEYVTQGSQLNDADLVHIQHEYAYWRGIVPGNGFF